MQDTETTMTAADALKAAVAHTAARDGRDLAKAQAEDAATGLRNAEKRLCDLKAALVAGEKVADSQLSTAEHGVDAAHLRVEGAAGRLAAAEEALKVATIESVTAAVLADPDLCGETETELRAEITAGLDLLIEKITTFHAARDEKLRAAAAAVKDAGLPKAKTTRAAGYRIKAYADEPEPVQWAGPWRNNEYSKWGEGVWTKVGGHLYPAATTGAAHGRAVLTIFDILGVDLMPLIQGYEESKGGARHLVRDRSLI